MNPASACFPFASACGAVLCLVAHGPAQGTVNASLLQAPQASAAAQAARASGTTALVAACKDAVVHVMVEVGNGKAAFKIERPSTGLVIDPRGLVLTWASLIREAEGASDKRVVLQLGDKRKLPAKIVATDARTGLALLEAERPDEK